MTGKLLGHARLQSTSRYAHLDDGHVLEAAERIGKLFAAAMGDTGKLHSHARYDSNEITHDW
jgi:hypothetical protein